MKFRKLLNSEKLSVFLLMWGSSRDTSVFLGHLSSIDLTSSPSGPGHRWEKQGGKALHHLFPSISDEVCAKCW